MFNDIAALKCNMYRKDAEKYGSLWKLIMWVFPQVALNERF